MPRILLVLSVLMLAALVAQPALAQRSQSNRDKYAFKAEDIANGVETSKEEQCMDKPLVLFVWAPDCPACIRHMPYAVALYANLDKDEVNFISLSMCDDKDDVQDFVDGKSLKFPVLWSGSGTTGSGFEYDGWPTTYVFRKGGKLQGLVESTGRQYGDDVAEMVKAALK